RRIISEGSTRLITEELAAITLVALFIFEEPDIDDLVRVSGEEIFFKPADSPLDGIRRTASNYCGLLVAKNDKGLLQHNGKACWNTLLQLLQMGRIGGVILNQARGGQWRRGRRCEQADAENAQQSHHGRKEISQSAGGPAGRLTQ